MKKKVLLTAFLCPVATLMFAQSYLSGTVVDEKGKPVSDVIVRIDGTSSSTVTDSDGIFRLEYAKSKNQVLLTHSLLYEKEKVQIDNLKSDYLQIKLIKKLFGLNEIVVTGTGTHNRLKNVPVQTTVLTKKEIESTGSHTFEDALSTLNASLATKGELGIVVNGLGNKNVLILVDGKKIAGDVSGETDLSRINITNIKRIEIVKGASSSLYGSEAMGGVINVITDMPRKPFNLTTTSRIAHHGQFFQGVDAEVKYQKFASQTSYHRKQTDGWQLSDKEEKREELVSTEKQAVTAHYSDAIKQKFIFNPSQALSINAYGGFYRKKTQRAYNAYDYNMLYKDYTLGAGVNYKLKDKKGYIALDSYFDDYEYYKDYFKDIKKSNIAAGDRSLSKRQRYTNTVLKGIFNPHANHKINTGFDLTTDYLKNPDNMKRNESAYTLAFYVQDEIKVIDKLSLVAGFRALHHEVFKNRFTPNISAMYSLEKFNFRASYASGFRAPSLMELYYDYGGMGGSTISQGNKNLKPEKSNYFSLNTEYFNSFFTFSLTGYVNLINDIIDRTAVELTPEDIQNGVKSRYLYQNVSRARSRGFDLAMKFNICEGVSLGTNYSFVDAKDTDTNRRLYGSSMHTGTVNAHWNKTWKNYNLNLNFNGRLQSNTNYANMTARPYQLWNIATTHRFSGIRSFAPEIGLGIENIFNFKDDKPFGYRYATTSPGTSVFASLTLKFNSKQVDK